MRFTELPTEYQDDLKATGFGPLKHSGLWQSPDRLKGSEVAVIRAKQLRHDLLVSLLSVEDVHITLRGKPKHIEITFRA